MKGTFGGLVAAVAVSTGLGADVSQELANAKNRAVTKFITVLNDNIHREWIPLWLTGASGGRGQL